MCRGRNEVLSRLNGLLEVAYPLPGRPACMDQ
jgi:hypothetical protein